MNTKQGWVDLVARFHVTAKGSTFVDKEYRFHAKKRKVVSKKTKLQGNGVKLPRA